MFKPDADDVNTRYVESPENVLLLKILNALCLMLEKCGHYARKGVSNSGMYVSTHVLAASTAWPETLNTATSFVNHR